jgi:hypothetical protein
MQKLFVAGLLITALTFIGCGKGSERAVLATVNNKKITAGYFKKQIDALPPQIQQAVAADPRVRKDFLNDLIAFETVHQEAKRQGIDKTAEFKNEEKEYRQEVERRIKEMQKRIKDTQSGVDDGIKNVLVSDLLKKELANKASIPTDREVKEYYNKHINEMRGGNGKVLSFKEAEPQLKSFLLQKRQREAYLAYAQGLKAKVTIDDKALDALSSSLAQPSAKQGLPMQHQPVPAEKK